MENNLSLFNILFNYILSLDETSIFVKIHNVSKYKLRRKASYVKNKMFCINDYYLTSSTINAHMCNRKFSPNIF